MACLTRPIIRESSPVYQDRKGRSPRTTGPVLKQDSESFPILSRISSRHVSQTRLARPPISPPSSDTPYELSDDDIIGPITPPPILRHLSNFAKRARERPKPYQRSGPNIVGRLCGEEECSGCTDTGDLLDAQGARIRSQRMLKRLTPEARAQAMIAIQADIEWRRVRAIAAALHVDVVQQHSMFLDITAKSEAETYVNAAAEPFVTASEALAGYTADELNSRENCSIAAFDLDATSFATADTEFDHVENFALTLLDPGSDGSTTSDDEVFD
ncbi:hypothetical protein DEU56DRAFT_914409 [Suillus clintonianus]|uniref:uncharacterized protein n=1 Tax=Suillus clintonianus TaxID=1904413 RepID=UPI001B882213|nr:uncharacterized protein DEU56DRAFT_914409 [Suillus clintonianus]KAG2131637.1 hypothetical protein DEU56DRAFT_914409 [Suillus clintonianus]